MKKSVIYLILAGIVGVLTFSYMKSESKGRGLQTVLGAPNLYTPLSELKGFDLNLVKGRFFVLHFWAKWCEPCADEIPHLVEFAKTVQLKKPLIILAVSLDPTLDEARLILPDQGAHLPSNFILALDPNRQLAEKIGSYQYPETYFVGPDGQVIEKWVGAQKWQKPEVIEFFKERIQ